jgi:hypothetical protein
LSGITNIEGLFLAYTNNDDLRFYDFRATSNFSLREEFQILFCNGLATLRWMITGFVLYSDRDRKYSL